MANSLIDHSNFSRQLLNDLNALEQMLQRGMFEDDITRLGAEQEFCTIDYRLQPSMIAMEMLEKLNDPHFTTELAKFNLEANLDPLELNGHCFSELENSMIYLLSKANKAAHQLGSKIILSGILPSIRKSDVVLDNMTPNPRYLALNEAILAARNDEFKFHISGLDELIAKSDSVLFESCNTSFQIHYQCNPALVNAQYNWAHAISGPVLSACVNSPIFLGKRLWSETRIALFQQSADTRKSINPLRLERERVTFGHGWRKGGALEIFRDSVSRYQVLLPLIIEEESLEILASGKIPKLKALATHNGTIYRWNRLCYGITNNKPHLRIENRYIPAGPSIVDEVANAALWLGLMHGMTDTYAAIDQHMEFDQAKHNFMTAAKQGLSAQFLWLDDETITAKDLLLNELLPLAHKGLEDAGVSEEDRMKYLGIIESRVKNGQTGAKWQLNSFNQLKKETSLEESVICLTEGIYQRQKQGNPVHEWSPLEKKEGGGWQNKYHKIAQVMSTDLLTIRPNDLCSMARNIMLWSGIHHLPVESSNGELLGLITSDMLMALDGQGKDISQMSASDIMIQEVHTANPSDNTIEAYHRMRELEIGCLPVLDEQKLVGILTLNDYLKLLKFFFDDL
jgi:CBS domain-containing protein/gamma-glutamyl:cysteine ligase YbdK (ATP-grasp superfamily)